MRKTNSKAKAKAKSYFVKDYLCDIHKSSMVYAALVRSPKDSGKIKNIDPKNLPEEFSLYTAREVPGNNTIKTFSTETNIFATDEVHYKGEPVGIITGPDLKTARKWAKRIQISFEDEKHAENSKKEENGKILAKRILKRGFFEMENALDKKNENEFFKSFNYDFEKNWIYNETAPYWTEPSGTFCTTESGIFNVYSTTQWPDHLEKSISSVLDLPEDKIEIRKTQTQVKNTNGSWRSSILSCQVAVASFIGGKPVKLIYSRDEQNTFMKNGLKTKIKVRTAVNEKGEIKAIKAEIKADAGYQNPFANEIADRLTVAFINMYAIENIYVETEITSSSLPPTSISTEKIDAASYFAIESQIQYISRKTKILPSELKAINFKKEHANFTFKNLKWEEAINAIIEKSDFKRKFSSYNLNSKEFISEDEHIFFSLQKRGISLSTALDGAFFLGSTFENYQQKMELTLEYDGKLTIKAPVPSIQVFDIWKNIVSEILEIAPNMVEINTDTETMIQSPFPEGFLSNVSIMSSLLKKCCLEIQKKRFKVALPITAKKSTSSVIKKAFDAQKFSGSPFYSTAFGSAIMEIELNPYTYKIIIKGIWIAIDCGEILSEKAAESSVRLAIRQELEELVENEKLTCESTNIFFVQSENPPCQIGSLVHNLIPGAFASSLSEAIGYSVTSVPCTEEEIFENINKAQKEIQKEMTEKEEFHIENENEEEEIEEEEKNETQTEKQKVESNAENNKSITEQQEKIEDDEKNQIEIEPKLVLEQTLDQTLSPERLANINDDLTDSESENANADKEEKK